ncbi:Uncharacterised protein [Vibrio cholerae]|nr:Uncharacterised protein [Vibrio cholerae]
MISGSLFFFVFLGVLCTSKFSEVAQVIALMTSR